MAKMLVPALTFPVRGAMLFVATIPVPASPSGGHIGTPDRSVPLGSRRRAPSSVSRPAAAPAVATAGRMSSSRQGCSPTRGSSWNRSVIALSNCPVARSIGNMPLASPTPSTFSPDSFQCT
jgi:hypothetical protein